MQDSSDFVLSKGLDQTYGADAYLDEVMDSNLSLRGQNRQLQLEVAQMRGRNQTPTRDLSSYGSQQWAPSALEEQGFIKEAVDFSKEFSEVARTAQSQLDLHSRKQAAKSRKYVLPAVSRGKSQLADASPYSKAVQSQQLGSGLNQRQLPPLQSNRSQTVGLEQRNASEVRLTHAFQTDQLGSDIDDFLHTSLVDLQPANNLPVLTMAHRQKLERELQELHERLNQSEHKRQETLVKNQELLTRVTEKDHEVAAITQRFNQLKNKSASAVLREEYSDLERKFAERGKQLAQAKKSEEAQKQKYQKQLDDALKQSQVLIDGLRNERLGLLNQTHSLRQLIAEMRTENGDLRQQVQALTKVVDDQGKTQAKLEASQQQAASSGTSGADTASLDVLKSLIDDYKKQAQQWRKKAEDLGKQLGQGSVVSNVAELNEVMKKKISELEVAHQRKVAQLEVTHMTRVQEMEKALREMQAQHAEAIKAILTAKRSLSTGKPVDSRPLEALLKKAENFLSQMTETQRRNLEGPAMEQISARQRQASASRQANFQSSGIEDNYSDNFHDQL